MLDQYGRFFSAAATSSAAFAGLLFVALSVANREDSEHPTRERRTVLAGAFNGSVTVGGPYLLAPYQFVGIGDREDETTHGYRLDDKHLEILWMM